MKHCMYLMWTAKCALFLFIYVVVVIVVARNFCCSFFSLSIAYSFARPLQCFLSVSANSSLLYMQTHARKQFYCGWQRCHISHTIKLSATLPLFQCAMSLSMFAFCSCSPLTSLPPLSFSLSLSNISTRLLASYSAQQNKYIFSRHRAVYKNFAQTHTFYSKHVFNCVLCSSFIFCVCSLRVFFLLYGFIVTAMLLLLNAAFLFKVVSSFTATPTIFQMK